MQHSDRLVMRSFRSLLLSLPLAFAALYVSTAQPVTWQQGAGPFGGDILSVAVTSNGTLLAGSWTGGLYRSTDGGATWNEPFATLHALKIRKIACGRNGTAYAAGHDESLRDTTRWRGLWISTDHGLTWKRAAEPQPNFLPTMTSIAPNGDLYLGGFSKVYRSRDNGLTWQAVANAGTSGFPTQMVAAPTNRLYFILNETGKPDQLIRHTPDAHNNVLTLPAGASTYYNTLGVGPDGAIYLGTQSGLFRSRDEGDTWTEINFDTLGSSLAVYTFGTDSAGTLFAGTGSTIYTSHDDGATWAPIRNGLRITGTRSFVTDQQGVTWLGTSGAGVYRTTDNGASWQWRSNGIINAGVTTIATSAKGYLFAGTDGAGLWRSADEGRTWQQLDFDESLIAQVTVHPGGDVYVAVKYPTGTAGGVSVSHDDGDSWQRLPKSPGSASHVAVNTAGDVFIDNESSVMRLRAGDTVWKTMRSFRSIDKLALDAAGVLHVAVQDSGMFATTDNGTTWRKGTGTGGNFTSYDDLVAGNGEAYIIDGSVKRSTDSGASWKPSGDLPQNGIFFVLALDKTGRLFLGSKYHGVQRSTNHGGNWDTINAGMLTKDITALALDSSGHLVAGTRSAGVMYTLGPASAVPPLTGAHATASRLACAPNPCRTTARLQFTTPNDGRIDIELVDAAGRVARRFAPALCPAGECTPTIDATGLAAGQYTCRVLQKGRVLALGTVVVVR